MTPATSQCCCCCCWLLVSSCTHLAPLVFSRQGVAVLELLARLWGVSARPPQQHTAGSRQQESQACTSVYEVTGSGVSLGHQVWGNFGSLGCLLVRDGVLVSAQRLSTHYHLMLAPAATHRSILAAGSAACRDTARAECDCWVLETLSGAERGAGRAGAGAGAEPNRLS